MNKVIQNKIERFRDLARTSAKPVAKASSRAFRSNDSLSKAIRDKKEADLFLAELDAAIKHAK